ncbi:antitoxin Xre/MbcA/ParS toxin-binding domain-containing protein [uncultured Enterovirga sp.]|uniref:antitoxin Xre/MbcA/ParS toxin-binding domain-containing protein n=1 Tax=uncultured Enterovirga sp. TaxID=2026352 RepID=UPI0035CB96A3
MADDLSPELEDRLGRELAVTAAAVEAFDCEDKAARWLRRETDPLAGQRPWDEIDTVEGARRVERLLGWIRHGMAA